MDIISKESAAVKWAEKKKLSNRLARKMYAAGYVKRSDRMAHCGDVIGLKVCPDCGHAHVASAQLCRDKLCPTCAWRLSLKRYAEMCKTFEALDISELVPLFWTLTVRNCAPADLSQTLQDMARDWNRLMARRKIKPLIKGWARSVEVTYNRAANTMHPHYHVIVLADKEQLQYLCKALTDRTCLMRLSLMLKKAWQESARLDYEPITDLRLITSKDGNDGDISAALLETYKYSVKASDLDDMPLDTFRYLVNGLAGKRMTAYGGVIKDARKLMCLSERDELTEADNDLESAKSLPCTRCGSTDLQLHIFRWAASESQYREVIGQMAQ